MRDTKKDKKISLDFIQEHIVKAFVQVQDLLLTILGLVPTNIEDDEQSYNERFRAEIKPVTLQDLVVRHVYYQEYHWSMYLGLTVGSALSCG